MKKTLLSRAKDVLRPIVYFIPQKVHAARRRQEMKRTRKAYTRDDVCAGLRTMPIPPKSVVLVHSSLKALGYVDEGAPGVVQALVEVFVRERGGTMVCPTFSIAGTMHAALRTGGIFDVRNTPSNLGAIPEAFRNHPEALRSVHPTHSFAAIGPNAHDIVDTHHTCGSSFGVGSPMGVVLESSGYLFGLGTTLGTVTFYHCLEEIEPAFPLDVYSSDSPFRARCRDYSGGLVEVMVKAHDPVVSRTRIDRPENEAIRSYVTRALEERAGMAWTTVCDARCWSIEARRMYDEMRRLMALGITIYSTKDDLARLGDTGVIGRRL
jgi:aminoglycoside 3-N-acetyltransferase